MFDQPLSAREPRVPLRFVQGGGMPSSLPRTGSLRGEFGNADHPQGLRLGQGHYYLRGRHWTVEPCLQRDGHRAVLRDDFSDLAIYWLTGESLETAIDRLLAQYGQYMAAGPRPSYEGRAA